MRPRDKMSRGRFGKIKQYLLKSFFNLFTDYATLFTGGENAGLRGIRTYR